MRGDSCHAGTTVVRCFTANNERVIQQAAVVWRKNHIDRIDVRGQRSESANWTEAIGRRQYVE